MKTKISHSKITSRTVRADFDDPRAVIHYTAAARDLGLWRSEKIFLTEAIPSTSTRILEAGCGAGRVTFALHDLGYTDLTAFDFSRELIDQALAIVEERQLHHIPFHHADARKLDKSPLASAPKFDALLFMFNGLMQIPLRRNRRRALRQLHALANPNAKLVFTTHDRDGTSTERALWKIEILRWAQKKQDPRLREFGDRYFDDDCGRTFMHLPDRAEILEDLAATGWRHLHDKFRPEIARESRPVLAFSDECRFWLAQRA